MDYLSKFNDIFQDMVHDLVNVFPSDSELRLYEFGLKATIVADNFIVSRIFNEQVVQVFGQQIREKDESFFVNKTYDEFNTYEDVGDIISKLKKCWKQLSDDNKNVIWKYLTVLLKLNEKIYA